MPNYSLIVNSKFRPFEFSEMLQPVMIAEQAHKELEDAYSELYSKASVWDKMTNSERDKVAHGIYSSYAQDLEQQAEELSKYGLNPSSRQQMLKMKGRYSRDIVPIEQAYKRREEQIKQQSEIMAKDPTHFFARKAAETSLDDFLANPTMDTLMQNYSGALLTQQVSNAAAALAKDARNDPKVQTELRRLLPYQYETIRRTGFDPETVRQAILNSPDANKILTGLVDNAMADSGMNDWNYMSPEDKERIMSQARHYANQGLWSAVGQTQYGQVTDQAGLAELQADLSYRNSKRQRQEEETRMNRINPLPLRSSQELSDKNRQIQEFMKKGYVKRDPITGRYTMTKEGWSEYRKMSPNSEKRMAMIAAGESSSNEDMIAARKMPDIVPSKFRTFMDELNGGKSFIDDRGNALPGWGPGRAGNLFASGIERYKEGSYDTYHSTEYDRQLGSSYGKEFTQQLWSAAETRDGEKVLRVVDFNGKDGFKTVGYKNAKDLKGYTVTNVRYYKNGDTAILQKDGEEPIRVKVPSGIHKGAESNVRAAIANADDWGLVLSERRRPLTTSTPSGGTRLLKDAQGNIMFGNEPLTSDDEELFLGKQARSLSDIYSYGSQYVVPSTTENEKYTPFGF